MKSFINVHFSDVEDERPSTLKLTPRQGAKLHGDVYALKEIHRSRHSVVYRGTVAITEYPVVLKLAYTDDTVADLRKEVALYSHQLLGLQGTVVPACFGLYEESSGGTCTGCLVLEDCGDPPDVSLEDLPMRQRVVVLRNLQKLHWAGVQHDDYRRQNIVIRDGQIRVIDFNKTSPHSCECPIEIKRPMERPDVLDFKCWNLYVFCIDLSVWSPSIHLGSTCYPAKEYPPQEIIDDLIPTRRIYCASEGQRELLLGRLRKIKQDLDHGAREEVSLGLVFIAGRPFDSESLPPQSFVDSYTPGGAWMFDWLRIEKLAEIFTEVNRRMKDHAPDQEIEEFIQEGIRNLRHLPYKPWYRRD